MLVLLVLLLLHLQVLLVLVVLLAGFNLLLLTCRPLVGSGGYGGGGCGGGGCGAGSTNTGGATHVELRARQLVVVVRRCLIGHGELSHPLSLSLSRASWSSLHNDSDNLMVVSYKSASKRVRCRCAATREVRGARVKLEEGAIGREQHASYMWTFGYVNQMERM